MSPGSEWTGLQKGRQGALHWMVVQKGCHGRPVVTCLSGTTQGFDAERMRRALHELFTLTVANVRPGVTPLPLAAPPFRPAPPSQVSTLCVLGDLVAAGGFMGELVVKRLSGPLQQPHHHHHHHHHQHSQQLRAHRDAAPYDNGARHVELLLPHYVRQQHPHLAGAGGAAAPRGHPPHQAGVHQPAAAAPAPAAAGSASGRLMAAGQRPGAAAGGGGSSGGMAHGSLLYCGRITNSDNGITNGLEIFSSPVHGTVVMASNNDAALRLFAAPHGEGSLRLLARWPYDWAVNYATMRPGAGVAAVVGDDPCTLLTDVHNGELLFIWYGCCPVARWEADIVHRSHYVEARARRP